MNVSNTEQNDGIHRIEGRFVLASGGAVTAQTMPNGQTKTMIGDNMSVVKAGGTATYTVTLKGTANLKMVEIVDFGARLGLGTLATAFEARVISITQTADTDDIVITISLFNNAATPAAAETTAACSVGFHVVIRTRRMDPVI